MDHALRRPSSRRAGSLPRLALVIAGSIALAGCDDGVASQSSPETLDIAGFQKTFSETFDHFDVSPWGPGTRWIAHTPWHGDFGDAAFADPMPGFPFQTAGHILRIEARKDQDGTWRSGLISSRDHDGRGGPGFAQAFGYFEMDAKLPPGPGVWPAFWLVGVTPKPRAEIDVLEYYGHAPDAYHVTVHVWADGPEKFGDGKVIDLPKGSASDSFNKYGVLIEPDWVTFYFNRRQVWRTPTRPEFKQPMYMLANLALGSGWPIDKTPNPSFLYIRSLAAYEHRS